MVTERADHLLDAGIDVGAIESGHAGIDEGGHVADRLAGVDVPMSASELPAASQQAGNAISGREFDGLDGHSAGSSLFGRGTAVTSEWRKTRFPIRVMRKRVGQFGSGQATSASVDIQSFGWVDRCLAGNKGRSAASE